MLQDSDYVALAAQLTAEAFNGQQPEQRQGRMTWE
jgi:hypothetical protein